MAATQVQCGVTNNRINREPIDSETVVYSYSALTEKLRTSETHKGFIYGGLITSVLNDVESEKNGPYYISYDHTKDLSYTADRIPLKGELDPVIYGGMMQPDYTKPSIYGIFRSAATGEYTKPTLSTVFEEVEIGTTFIPEVIAHWPLSTDCSYGTRQNKHYATNGESIEMYSVPGSHVLGYSYGVNGSNSVSATLQYGSTPTNKKVNSNDTSILFSQILINKEGVQEICKLDSVNYLKSSYSFFPDLYKSGITKYAYGVGDKAWFNVGTFISEAKYTIDARYRYYFGFSDEVPSSIADVKAGNSHLLNLTSDPLGTSTTMVVRRDGAKKRCFWVAYPTKYALVSWDEDYRVMVTQPDGISFDLMSGWQHMKRKIINMPLGNGSLSTEYYVAYCEFDYPLGNPSDTVSFRIIPTNQVEYIYYLNDERNDLYVTDEDVERNIILENANNIIIDDDLFA